MIVFLFWRAWLNRRRHYRKPFKGFEEKSEEPEFKVAGKAN
jgi:hypothetical protein